MPMTNLHILLDIILVVIGLVSLYYQVKTKK